MKQINIGNRVWWKIYFTTYAGRVVEEFNADSVIVELRSTFSFYGKKLRERTLVRKDRLHKA